MVVPRTHTHTQTDKHNFSILSFIPSTVVANGRFCCNIRCSGFDIEVSQGAVDSQSTLKKWVYVMNRRRYYMAQKYDTTFFIMWVKTDTFSRLFCSCVFCSRWLSAFLPKSQAVVVESFVGGNQCFAVTFRRDCSGVKFVWVDVRSHFTRMMRRSQNKRTAGWKKKASR